MRENTKNISDVYFKPNPFWFLNHELDDKEIIWQIRKLYKMGLGGAVLHSRHGRRTPYLSKEWFDRLETAIKEGEKYGLVFWLYDEDNWPSGPSGGALLDKHPEYCMQYLYMACRKVIKAGQNIQMRINPTWHYVLACPIDKRGRPLNFPQDVVDLKHLLSGNCTLRWNVPRENQKWIIWIIGLSKISPRTEFYDRRYLDVLNPKAVRAFINFTHRRYALRFKKYFGNTLLGFFTDEPAAFYGREEKDISFSPKAMEVFNTRYKYNLESCLPALFEDLGEKGEEIRIVYYDILRRLYCDAFYRTIYKYCCANKLKSIGHMLYEGELSRNVRFQFDFFDMTEWMDWAGVDHLGKSSVYDGRESIDGLNNTVGPKMASSSAHLLGKKIVLSETFGEIGWDYSLAEIKRLFDAQLCLGVNYIIPHAFYYSIQGFRKSDCPPDEFWRVPMCEQHYAKFSNYMTNACRHFTDGRHIGEVAVLYPNRTIWAHMIPGDKRQCLYIEDIFNHVTHVLLQNHYQFDYINERLLCNAKVAKGFLIAGTGQTAEKFSVLIIPACKHLLPASIEKICKFLKAGGKVILIDCHSDLLSKFNDYKWTVSAEKLTDELLHQVMPFPTVKILPKYLAKQMVTYHYKKNGCDKIALFNSGKKIKVRILFLPKGEVGLRDLETDRIEAIQPRVSGQYREIQIAFDRWETKVIEVGKGQNFRKRKLSFPSGLSDTRRIILQGPWQIETNNFNTFPLNSWQVDNIMSSNAEGNGCMRAYSRYRTRFLAEYRPEEIFLLLDGLVAEKYIGSVKKDVVITLNGSAIEKFEKSDVLDHFMYKASVTSLVRKGRNVLEIVCSRPFYEAPTISDPAILLGRFSVFKEIICKPVMTLDCGNWCRQGFPYFAGTITYIKKLHLRLLDFKQAFLEFQGVGHAVRVEVNGRYTGSLAWSPWIMEISKMLRTGQNIIRLSVSNNLVNMLAGWKTPAGLLNPPILHLRVKNNRPAGQCTVRREWRRFSNSAISGFQ